MPVTVPVNNSSYNDSSVSLLTSPQQSVSPRPPSHEMQLDVQQNGGYPHVPHSPSPGPPGHSSPSPTPLKRCATSPDSHAPPPASQLNLAMNRNNLRVVIPQSGGRDADNGLGHGLGYGNSNHGHNFQSGEFGEISNLQQWNQSNLPQNNHKWVYRKYDF